MIKRFPCATRRVSAHGHAMERALVAMLTIAWLMLGTSGSQPYGRGVFQPGIHSSAA